VRQEDTLQDARYAPPQAQVEDIEFPAGADLVLAGRGRRLGAAMIDGLILLALYWLALMAATWAHWYTPEAGRSLWQPMVLPTLAIFALFCISQGFLLASRGQTIGKLALGIRITRPDGGRVPLLRMLGLRYGVGHAFTIIPMLGQIFAIVDSLMIFRHSRRCLHDVMADTIVVKA